MCVIMRINNLKVCINNGKCATNKCLHGSRNKRKTNNDSETREPPYQPADKTHVRILFKA